ncbi:MAG: phosphate ABC transporter permease PstA [Deltaproteobacteria bacterium]|nr:phosphate ABC transporter permease PstA [Deltaproteobacteria bacterium]
MMSWWDKVKSASVKTAGILALFISLLCLGFLLWDVFSKGWNTLSWDFLFRIPSRRPEEAGIKPAILGTLWVMTMTTILAVPAGILTGIYLEEYAQPNWFTKFIRINIANLAGVPSVVYGMLGLAVFVRTMGLGRSVLAGAMTMGLLILPTIIIATSEALKAVPDSIRFGAYGVGASRRQVIWYHVLPEALPGILTGIILSLSRAIGESSPLILIGALSFVTFAPQNLLDGFTVLAIQIFNWAGRPQEEFHHIAASAIIVLLIVTLSLNTLAIFLRTRMSRRKEG